MNDASSHTMLVLALDTTSRGGSVAIARDGEVLDCHTGRADRTHAERLPADLISLLDRHRVALPDVDAFAVAAGPGSFTGLRIGIATIQGLAFAHKRLVVPVSALEALAWLGAESTDGELVAAWIDAQRREVFTSLFSRAHGASGRVPRVEIIEGAAVDQPVRTLERWRPLLSGRRVWFIGDGALAYRHLLAQNSQSELHLVESTPALAPAIARMATVRMAEGGAVPPHAVRPLYVRRADAELAREGRAAMK